MTVVEGQGTEEVSGPALYIERRLRLGEEGVVVLVEARQNVHRGVVQLAVVVGGGLPVVGVVITPEASVIITGEGDLVIKPAQTETSTVTSDITLPAVVSRKQIHFVKSIVNIRCIRFVF